MSAMGGRPISSATYGTKRSTMSTNHLLHKHLAIEPKSPSKKGQEKHIEVKGESKFRIERRNCESYLKTSDSKQQRK